MIEPSLYSTPSHQHDFFAAIAAVSACSFTESLWVRGSVSLQFDQKAATTISPVQNNTRLSFMAFSV